jgi:hypothetical protein
VSGIDEGADAALLLLLGNDMQGERRLARAFRAIDLDDAPLGQAADPQRDVEAERPRRRRLDVLHRVVAAEPHDRTLAELPFDLRERRIERLLLVAAPLVRHVEDVRRGHLLLPCCIAA